MTGLVIAVDDPRHAEVKSMHTAAAARRQGIGRAMVQRLLRVARDRGYDRVRDNTFMTLELSAPRAGTPAQP